MGKAEQTAYYIGQVLPWEPPKPVQIGRIEPAWFAFLTPPQKEISALAWFNHKGVEAWYPSEMRRRRISRGKRKFAEYEARIVPRYIFARFTGVPQWDVLQSCRYLSRVIGVKETPLPVTDTVMAQMAQVPGRLEIIRKREVEKRIIRPGDKARIMDGAMEGWIVDVSHVHAGIAAFIVPLLGERVTRVDVARLEKVSKA